MEYAVSDLMGEGKRFGVPAGMRCRVRSQRHPRQAESGCGDPTEKMEHARIESKRVAMEGFNRGNIKMSINYAGNCRPFGSYVRTRTYSIPRAILDRNNGLVGVKQPCGWLKNVI